MKRKRKSGPGGSEEKKVKSREGGAAAARVLEDPRKTSVKSGTRGYSSTAIIILYGIGGLFVVWFLFFAPNKVDVLVELATGETEQAIEVTVLDEGKPAKSGRVELV